LASLNDITNCSLHGAEQRPLLGGPRFLSFCCTPGQVLSQVGGYLAVRAVHLSSLISHVFVSWTPVISSHSLLLPLCSSRAPSPLSFPIRWPSRPSFSRALACHRHTPPSLSWPLKAYSLPATGPCQHPSPQPLRPCGNCSAWPPPNMVCPQEPVRPYPPTHH